MKLLYIANLRLPTEKAYGIQITEMCRSFSDIGQDVTLVFPYRLNHSGKSVFEYYGIENTFQAKILPAPDFYFSGKMDKLSVPFKNMISAIALAFYALTHDFDIIFSRDELPLYFLSFFKKNIIFEAHRFSGRRTIFYNRFKNAGIKIVVISEGLKKAFIDFGFKNSGIVVLPDGVNLKEFNLDISREDARDNLNLPEDKRLIGYVGSFTTMGAHKGLDVLFEALKLINNKNISIALVGGAIDKKDEEYYEKLAESLGIKDRVLFKGRVEHRQVPVYLKAFDVLTMPFPHTPHYAFYMSPLKLFEYMASKRPIVSSDLPSVREVLNEENSVLVRPDDAQSLADGLLKVIDDKAFSDKISQVAFNDVSGYTWQKRAENILVFSGNNTHVQ